MDKGPSEEVNKEEAVDTINRFMDLVRDDASLMPTGFNSLTIPEKAAIAKKALEIKGNQNNSGDQIASNSNEEAKDNGESEAVAEEKPPVVDLDKDLAQSTEVSEAPEPKKELVSVEKSELALKIEACSSFDELYQVIRKSGGIQGSTQFHQPEKIIDLIEGVRSGATILLSSITEKEGLKAKVKSLYEAEKSRAENVQVEPEQVAEVVPEPVVEAVEEPAVIEPELVEPQPIESKKEEPTLEPEPNKETKIFDTYKVEELSKLLDKEQISYLDSLREKRDKIFDRAKIEASNLAKSRAIQWYAGLSQKQKMAVRIALSVVVGGTVGFMTGAAASMGVVSYVGWRAVRVGLSATAGAGAREWANKRWSIEDLNKEENKEIEDLENSGLSVEEKQKGLEDIKKRYGGQRTKMMAKKIGVTALAGAGAGMLTGLAENLIMGNDVSSTVLESKGSKADTLQEHKLPPRKGFGAVLDKPKVVNEPMDITDRTVPVSKEMPLEVAPTSNANVSGEEVLKGLFDDPSVAKHEVSSGDSVWKMLEKTLEHNEKFRDLSGAGTPEEIVEQIEAKKTRVLQALVGKVLEDHDKYGVGENGELVIGKEVDFSELFKDKESFEKVLNEAESLKPSQITSIISNNQKIEAWVSANPGKPVNVDEILNMKPKIEIEDNKIPSTKEAVPLVPVKESKVALDVPLESSEIKADLDKSKLFEVKKPTAPVYEGGVLSKEVAAHRMEADLSMAKSRVIPVDTEKGLRTMAGDISSIESSVKNAFEEEVNNIYGKEGFWGIGKVNGMNSKEWGEMARLPATKVVEYYTGDSAKSGLPADVIEKLVKSKNHNALMKQTIGLMEQAGGAVKPAENETVQDFIKRLGGYVMKVHMQNLQDMQKAA